MDGLQNWLSQDPFQQSGVAKVEIVPFEATMAAPHCRLFCSAAKNKARSPGLCDAEVLSSRLSAHAGKALSAAIIGCKRTPTISSSSKRASASVRPDRTPEGKSHWVMSPLTITVTFSPRRVKTSSFAQRSRSGPRPESPPHFQMYVCAYRRTARFPPCRFPDAGGTA